MKILHRPILYLVLLYMVDLNNTVDTGNITAQLVSRGQSTIKLPSVSVPLVWIRDHCRSEAMYDYTTNQRKVKVLDSMDNALDVKEIKVYPLNGTFEVIWKDEHKTSDSILSTVQTFQKSETIKILWNNEKHKTTPYAVVKQKELKKISVKKTIFESLSKYGLAMIEDVEVSYDKTVETVQSLAPLMRTVPFGEHEVIHSQAGKDRSDFGYTTRSLEAHTDNAYFTDPAGLITFHCLQTADKGGQTLLVDGFHVTEQLKTNHPEKYLILTQYPMPYHYIHANATISYHYHEADFIIKENLVTRSMEQIRYAMPHRAPLNTVPLERMEEFYSALETLTRIIEDPLNEVWIKLEPGTILIVDNWRILHGRSSFSGKRSLFTSYVGRSDFKSMAKVLDVDL